jgi:hypothetical protein
MTIIKSRNCLWPTCPNRGGWTIGNSDCTRSASTSTGPSLPNCTVMTAHYLIVVESQHLTSTSTIVDVSGRQWSQHKRPEPRQSLSAPIRQTFSFTSKGRRGAAESTPTLKILPQKKFFLPQLGSAQTDPRSPWHLSGTFYNSSSLNSSLDR